MRKWRLALLTALAIAGSTPATTQAHDAAKLVKCSTKGSVESQLTCAKVNIKHGNQLLRFLRKHRSAGTYRSRRSVRRSGTYLVAYGRRQLQIATYRSYPPHYHGWICIHNGEGAWDANTGNGYYGGLQAHEGWGGIHHMSVLSPLAQMWVAERELRKNNYSHSWLAGQWPNTYPPCSSYF